MESNIYDQPKMYFLSFIRTRLVKQTVSYELQCLIISALNHGKNFTLIKILFNARIQTARIIYKIYHRDSRIEIFLKGGNRRSKLTDEQKESLFDILEEDYSHTIQRICDLFFERQNIRIGRSTATRGFKDFHYTLIIFRQIRERRNNP
ncbi:hypothetical protein RF11_15409 [Thelohanellus kitauei]|uniref:Uncharacterized protein n=1 Tax=Thelohanellus kitauei TaxID=669202 RepID=A0A0C2MZE6_THEKT|nr:hypothetical protein RF11_15409 [Thelohanellus kitauei]